MNRRYTLEELEFIKEGYLVMKIEHLTIAFNAEFGTDKSDVAIKSAIGNHGFRCGRKGNDRLIKQKRLLTSHQEKYLRKIYKKYTAAESTSLLNAHFGTSYTIQQIRTFVHNNHISSGRTGCFHEGRKPWNAGTKGLVKPNSGNFKKGHVPANIKPIGHERICSKDGFVLVKVAEKNPYTGSPTRYKPKHIHLWELANGPVAAGHIVVFKNGDRTDIRIENLEMITKAENMRRNSIHNLPEALADVCRIKGVLNRHINKRTGVDEKQD